MRCVFFCWRSLARIWSSRLVRGREWEVTWWWRVILVMNFLSLFSVRKREKSIFAIFSINNAT